MERPKSMSIRPPQAARDAFAAALTGYVVEGDRRRRGRCGRPPDALDATAAITALMQWFSARTAERSPEVLALVRDAVPSRVDFR